MPSVSPAQKRLMDAAAHNPAFAKKVGVPTKVAKEFSQADKGRKFERGGEMKESKAMAKKEVGFMKKAGAPKSMIKHEKAEMMGMKSGGAVFRKAADGVAKKGKTKGTQIAMKKGGKCR